MRTSIRPWLRTAATAATTLLAGGAVLFGACGEGEGEDRPNVEVIGGEGSVSVSGVVEGYGPPLYEPSTNQESNLAIGLDLKELRALMAGAVSDAGVDWAAVKALYEDGKNQPRSLAEMAANAPMLAFPDAASVYGTEQFADRMIRDGIDGTGRGEGLRDNSRRQLVDKGVQILMYGESLAALDAAETSMERGDKDSAMAQVDAAWAILSGARDDTGTPNNGLLATALGREDDFSMQGRLARPLEAALFSALNAAERGDEAAFNDELETSRQYLNTVFYLSVLRYARVLPGDARESDREAHLAEGWAFFQALRAQVAAASPEAADTIESAYTSPAGERFAREKAEAVFAAMNEPAVLSALDIPEDFQVTAP